jgi:nucleoside-diphosphate-sugar epimerase
MKDGRVAMVDARDVAAVAAAVLTGRGHEGKTYAVTGGEPLSLGDVAATISRAAGRPVRYDDVSAAELKESLRKCGLPEWLAEDVVGLHAFYGAGAGAGTTRIVRDLTGALPRTYDAFAREFAWAFGADGFEERTTSEVRLDGARG